MFSAYGLHLGLLNIYCTNVLLIVTFEFSNQCFALSDQCFPVTYGTITSDFRLKDNLFHIVLIKRQIDEGNLFDSKLYLSRTR